MPTETFEEFAAAARARGFDDIAERHWARDTQPADLRLNVKPG